MAIGTYEQLKNASQGKRVPRGGSLSTSMPVPEPRQPDSYKAWEQALSRKSMYGSTPEDWATAASMGQSPPTTALFEQPTDLYGQLFSGVKRPGGGLSSKGKYGGFFSAEDLKRSIEGTSMRFKSTADRLRQEAMNRYTQVEQMYQPERKKMEMGLFKGTVESPTADDNYMRRLADWASSSVKPAEEYLKTAQQIEATPISTLAETIASRVYGMNPDLAVGKFSDLDEAYASRMRDIESMKRTGMPYSQYEQYVKQLESQQKSQLDEQAAFLEDQIASNFGVNPRTISTKMGRTPEQIYSIYASADDGAGSNYVDEAILSIQGNDYNTARDIAKLAREQGAEDVYQLIINLMGIYGKSGATYEEQLQNLGLVD